MPGTHSLLLHIFHVSPLHRNFLFKVAVAAVLLHLLVCPRSHPCSHSIKPAMEYETTEYLLLLEIVSCFGYCETSHFMVSFLPPSPLSVDWLCGVQMSHIQRAPAWSPLPGLLRVDYVTLAPASLQHLPANHRASLGSPLSRTSLAKMASSSIRGDRLPDSHNGVLVRTPQWPSSVLR